MSAQGKIYSIVIHHTASGERDFTWEDIRKWHIARGWSDIGYHYGIVLDPYRGAPGDLTKSKIEWAVKFGRDEKIVGAHAKGFNQNSLGIAFEGNYEKDYLLREAYDIGLDLIDRLLIKHSLDETKVTAHRDLPYPTLCPGRYFPINEMVGKLKDLRFIRRAH